MREQAQRRKFTRGLVATMIAAMSAVASIGRCGTNSPCGSHPGNHTAADDQAGLVGAEELPMPRGVTVVGIEASRGLLTACTGQGLFWTDARAAEWHPSSLEFEGNGVTDVTSRCGALWKYQDRYFAIANNDGIQSGPASPGLITSDDGRRWRPVEGMADLGAWHVSRYARTGTTVWINHENAYLMALQVRGGSWEAKQVQVPTGGNALGPMYASGSRLVVKTLRRSSLFDPGTPAQLLATEDGITWNVQAGPLPPDDRQAHDEISGDDWVLKSDGLWFRKSGESNYRYAGPAPPFGDGPIAAIGGNAFVASAVGVMRFNSATSNWLRIGSGPGTGYPRALASANGLIVTTVGDMYEPAITFSTRDRGCTWDPLLISSINVENYMTLATAGVARIGDRWFIGNGESVISRDVHGQDGDGWKRESVPTGTNLGSLMVVANCQIAEFREAARLICLAAEPTPDSKGEMVSHYDVSVRHEANDWRPQGITKWSPQWSAGNRWVAYAPENGLFVPGSESRLATSVDAGATWTVLKDLPRKRSFALGLPAITALAGNHLYLVDDYLLYDLKFGDGDWENPKAFGLNGSINSLWADPQEPDVVVAATLEGLFWSADAGLNFQRADLNLGSAGTSVVSVLESGPGALLVGVSDAASPQIAGGLIPQKWYLVGDRIPRPTWKRRWQSSRDWVVENHTQWWFYPFVSIGLFLLTYLLGCIGLVLIATRHGSYVFARSWITEFASAPLRKLPSIGSWALFLGYATRLARLPAVAKAANQYFGLPAVLGDGTPLLPDDDGKTLHESIAGLSAAQRPVYLSGSGGAGKSTLFARLCWLLVTKRAPTAWRGFRPILVPAISYEKSPLQAITTTLRDRDGVAVDEDIVRAQLQTGRFVVMFDGMSELPTADTAIGEVIRFCRSADYRNCRFLLAGRSMAEATDLPVVELQPMNSKAISDLLEKSGLGEVRKERIKRQLSAFESSAIVPLLWSMAVEESRDGNVSQSRAQLYERYFRRLLNVQGAQFDLQWAGWRSLFEQMARWFFLASSSRGQGLPHGALVDRLTAAGAPKDTESPVAAVIRRYPMPFKSALELLESADEAGILEGGRRWRFAHDTYEEFFAACWITACVEEQQPIEISANWYVSPDKRQELAELRKFCADMGSATALREYEEKIPMPDA